MKNTLRRDIPRNIRRKCVSEMISLNPKLKDKSTDRLFSHSVIRDH